MPVYDRENTLVIELPAGRVVIELLPEVAAENVARIKELARSGAYDGVGFHRVIDGFVAQGGDVEYGEVGNGYNPVLVGTGGSGLPDLPLEASAIPGAARRRRGLRRPLSRRRRRRPRGWRGSGVAGGARRHHRSPGPAAPTGGR